jgi:hypothetical protein
MMTQTTLPKCRRREYVSIAFFLIVGFVYLIPNGLTTSLFPTTVLSARDSEEVTTIHGIFWKKYRGGPALETDSPTPVTEGSVFVTDTDLTRLYGETTTRGEAGQDTGFFQLTNLPANQNLLVFYYDSAFPGYLQVEDISLATNEDRELAPNDPNVLVTQVMTATDLLDTLKGLVNENIELALQANETETAERLKTHLSKLSLPPEPVEPYEPEESGGLSGKTIGLIGGAAGGAAFAVASATGGSDEAGSAPTGTTSIVPWTPSPGSTEPTFSIRADRRWENSGVNVAAGNRVRFRASGTVTIDAAGTTATPDGSGLGNAGSSAVLPGAPLHGLVCAWDPAGNTKFFVGSENTVQATIDGTIYCTVNEQPDRDSSYMDNTGAWTIEYRFMMPWD